MDISGSRCRPCERFDHLVQAPECAAADEQDIGGIDLEKLLLGVLAPAVGRDRGNGPLDQLEQGLLDALARHVTGDGDVVGLARDLVDLVDVDDAGLRLATSSRTSATASEDVLDILAHIPGLGQGGGVGDGEGNIEQGQGPAKRVLPEPVGPISRTLVLAISISSLASEASMRL